MKLQFFSSGILVQWACSFVIFIISLPYTKIEAQIIDLDQGTHYKFINGKLFRPPSDAERREVKTVTEDWFSQPLDHFNAKDKRKWKQKYYMNKDYFKPEGPVFLIIGGEGGIFATNLNFGAYVDYAKQVGALLFNLEHRYYGDSKPTSDTSVANLQFLSSRQAIEDMALFIKGMKSKYKLKNNKWFSLGGSYAGSLAAWVRLKHPDLLYGAVASSGPLEAVPDFKGYYEVVRHSLKSKGTPECVAQIQDATFAISEILRSKDPVRLTTLKNLFRLCDRVNVSNDLDIWSFYDDLAGNFASVVQYNMIPGSGGKFGFGNVSISDICGLMTNSDAPSIENYAAVNDLMLDKVYKEKCSDVSYASYINEYNTEAWNSSSVVSAARQWFYQTCSEFGFYGTSSEKDVFGPFPLRFFTQQCEDVFGMKFNRRFLTRATNSTNDYYKKKNLNVSRVIFVNGSIDPWHALGITTNSSAVGSPDRDNLIIYIRGAAHCADYYSQTSRDSAQLVKARQRILEKLIQWIAE